MIVSQCLYTLPTFSNSISLALTLADPSNSSHMSPRDLWRQRFHESAEQDEDSGAGQKVVVHVREAKEEEAVRPMPVSGLGEEAYWVRSFVGTLYVLKGNAFLRISIGGKLDDSARLKKAQILARDALARLP